MLLASNDAATTLAIFHELFMVSPADRVLPEALLLERLGFALDELRAHGHELTQTPQGYLQYWRLKGWLARTLQHGSDEEEYSLTPEAASGVRLMLAQLQPRTFATESRLSSVMHQVMRLDDETNSNPATRLATLHAEKERIEREIEQLGQGKITVLPDDRALERVREILQQANELADDFQNVRGAFERLNQDLRAKLLETSGSRAATLDALFDGFDFIRSSEAGRTFDAFWRLLTDVEQSSALDEAIEHLLDRRFSASLSLDERRILQRLTTRLMDEASSVQAVVRLLSENLNRFVRNETPATSKRIHDALHQAKLAALSLKDMLGPVATVPFVLTQSVPQIRSVAQLHLRDPELSAPAAPIAAAESSTLSLDAIQSLIGQSEIDFKALHANLREALATAERVTLGELLERFPATQGFGTVVGYITLGTKHGTVGSGSQVVCWTGRDGVARSAELPDIHFTQEQIRSVNA